MSRVSPLIRAALIVRDVSVSKRFYQDVLGFESVQFEGDLSRGNAWRLLGVTDRARVEACILKAQDPAIGMIGLFQVDDPTMQPPVEPGDAVRVGDVVLVMNCDDLNPVQDALNVFGARILSPPLKLETEHFVGVREMMFMDPDGTKINLIERPVPTVTVEIEGQ